MAQGRTGWTFGAALLGALVTAGCAAGAASGTDRGTVTFGAHVLHVELAADPVSREQGLAGRGTMAPDAGMLFLFPWHDRWAFWMRQTPLPLSIAFLADDGMVVHLADMQPHDETPVVARLPVRYALEVHQGWFTARGIGVGAQAHLHWPEGLRIR